MTKGHTAPIYTIGSNDTYVFIEKVGNRVNKLFEASTSQPNSKQTLQNNRFDEDSHSTLRNNNSVKLSNTASILINEHNYEIDLERGISDVDLSSEKLDLIQSGESLIKYYYFDASKYSRDINKCIDFWKAVMEQKDLKPVECIYKVSNFDFSSESERGVEDEEKRGTKGNIIRVMSCNIEEPKKYLWYNALLEMQKKNMDELALAASGPRCKLCDSEMGMAKLKTNQGKNYSEEELKDNEDVVCLNSWKPKSIKKPQARQLAELNKLKKREDSLELDNIDDDKTVRKCACAKSICKCALTMDKKTEKVIPPKELEIKVIQNEKSVPVVSERKGKNKTEKCAKFHTVTLNQKVSEKIAPPTKHRKSIIKTPRTPTTMAPASTVQKTVQFKSHEVNVTELEKTKCDLCKKEKCTCKEYFDEDSREFVNEVRYELQHLRKDKACCTNDQKLKLGSSNLNFCSVCEDKTMCDIMHQKIQTFEVVVPTKEEDIYLETVFESGRKWQTGSTIILPRAKGKKKSMAFGSIVKSTLIVKDIPDVLDTKSSTAVVKSFEKKREPKNENVVYTAQDQSEETIQESKIPNTKERTLLWYSSEIQDN